MTMTTVTSTPSPGRIFSLTLEPIYLALASSKHLPYIHPMLDGLKNLVDLPLPHRHRCHDHQ